MYDIVRHWVSWVRVEISDLKSKWLEGRIYRMLVL